jgi:hypothetical protein
MKKLIVVLSLFSSYAYASKNIDLKKAQNMMQKSTWAFEENKGQVTGADGKNVKFVFKDGNLSMFLMQTGIAYQFHKVTYPEGYKPLDKFASMEEHEKMEKLQSQIQTETYRMDVILEGANPNPKIKTEGKSSDYIQYYNHNALDVRSYQKVTYYEVYPHIDWVVYVNKNAGDNEPKVKYDFVVHPGGDPSQIKLKTEWVEELTSNEDGSLTMKNRMGSVTEQRPISFQDGKDVKTNFVVNNNTISFQLEKFNINTDIVIDPGLVWGTFYGGSGSEKGKSCAVDGSGNVYLAGETNSISSIASGGHRNTFSGNTDAFLVKFNTNGVRQWATYYGGGVNDFVYGCTTDGSGNVYLAGSTVLFYGFTDIASGGHQNTLSGYQDAFLVKFNSAGIRQWGTYYGGEGTEIGSSCAVDRNGNVYLAGWTSSNSGIASGGHQNTFSGGSVGFDAFLVKFNSSGIRLWGTYYGGGVMPNFSVGGDDFAESCATDSSGNVYLAGQTSSRSGIASGGHKNTYGDDNGTGTGYDAFLVKFNSLGVRQWGTYYGGWSSEYGKSCATDGSGNVFIAGYTGSNSNIASGGHQNTFGGGNNDAFLVKFNSSGIRQWGTYYGGSSDEYAICCAVDRIGNVYFTGGLIVVKYNTQGLKQFDSLWYGRRGGSNSCAIDYNGYIYVAGTSSYNPQFDTTYLAIIKDGHQNIHGGGQNDGYLSKSTNPSYPILNFTACNSFYWDSKNKNYTASNNTDTLKRTNTYGFDSVVTLNLTINYNNSSTYTTSACGSYYWAAKNKTYTASNYSDTAKLTNARGCDSIVTLNLTIKNSTASTFTTSACGSYYWAAKDKIYTASNYSDTIKLVNSVGCDSIITLNLTIKKNPIYTNYDTSVCSGFYWTANKRHYYSGPFGSFHSDTVKLITSIGCDSIVNLNLRVNPLPSPIIYNNTGNLLITQSYNTYQWLNNGTNISGAVQQSYNATSDGNYQVEVTDTNNCQGISSSINIIVSSINEIDENNFKIYPNPSERMLHIETNASGNWQAIITDVKGSQINQIHFNKSTQLDISNYAPGVYYIQLTGKENVLNYKFMKK